LDRRNETSSALQSYALWPMVLLALVNLVDQIDMAIVRGVLPILEDEWHLSDLQLGSLGFAFVFVNAIATIPAGWLADRVRRTRLVGWTLLSWSGLIALSALAVNYVNLFAARAAMGVGQAIDDPSSTSLLGDFYPPRLRGRVFSLQQVSVFVGGGIGLALGGFVGAQLGWRWAFALVGMPGSLIALLVFRLREPKRGEADAREHGIELPDEAPDDPATRPTYRQLFTEMRTSLIADLKTVMGIRTMRYILVGVSALLFTVAGIGYWLAVYHERYSDMSIEQATAVTAVVFGIGGLIGTFGGGWIADRMAVRGPTGRILLVVWGTITAAVLFVLSFAIDILALRLVLQLVGVAAGAGGMPALRASMLDVLPADSRGVGSSALALMSTVFGTALAPPLVGLLSDMTSLVTAFYIVLPPVIIGEFVLLRARHTIAEDAQAIITAMLDRVATNDASP
jgi:MFS family permease